MTTRNCNQCGIEYESSRSTSKFCSDACRVKAARFAKGEAKVKQRRFDNYHAVERTLLYNMQLWHKSLLALKDEGLLDDEKIDDKVVSIMGVVLITMQQKPDTLKLRLSKRTGKYLIQKSML